MFDQILPQRLDNTYRGRKAALWLFALLLLMKAGMSFNSIFNGREVASSADGIPLDTYTPGGAQAVVSLFAIWGLAHLVICAIGVVALVRYRAMVPFLFALLLLELLSRRLIFRVMPIARTGATASFVVNLILLALLTVGLALSLWRQNRLPKPA